MMQPTADGPSRSTGAPWRSAFDRVACPLALLAAPVAVTAACYAPTEIVLVLSTDSDCGQGLVAAIYTGSGSGGGFEVDPAARAERCVARASGDADLGSLVVLPSGDRDGRARVKVVLARDGRPEDCVSDPTKCNVATRSFSFVEHRSLRLPIRLRDECFDTLCPDGETCGPGRTCIADTVTCSGGDCVLPGETAGPVSPDAGLPPPDPDPDAGKVSPPCTGPDGTGIVATASNLPEPRAAVSVDGVFYYLDVSGGRRAIFSVPTTGGPPTELVALGTDAVIDLKALSGAGWALLHSNEATATVTSATRTDPVGEVAQGQFQAIALTRDGSDGPVAYLARASQVLVAVAGDQPVVSTFHSEIGGRDIAADESAVYLASDTGGHRLARSTGTGTIDGLLFTTPGSSHRVFAEHGKTVFALRRAAPNATPAIYEMTGTGTPNIVAAPDALAVSSFAVDATHVYWTDGAAISRMERLPQTKRVSVHSVPGEKVGHLALVGGCLYYWSERAGEGQARLRVEPLPP